MNDPCKQTAYNTAVVANQSDRFRFYRSLNQDYRKYGSSIVIGTKIDYDHLDYLTNYNCGRNPLGTLQACLTFWAPGQQQPNIFCHAEKRPRADLDRARVTLVHQMVAKIVVRVRQPDLAHQQHAVTFGETAGRIDQLVGATAEKDLKTLERRIHVIGDLHCQFLAVGRPEA